jgi:hypothetical protein
MAIKATMKYNNGNINNLRKLIDESFSRAFLREKLEEANRTMEIVNKEYGTDYKPYDYNDINIIGY